MLLRQLSQGNVETNYVLDVWEKANCAPILGQAQFYNKTGPTNSFIKQKTLPSTICDERVIKPEQTHFSQLHRNPYLAVGILYFLQPGFLQQRAHWLGDSSISRIQFDPGFQLLTRYQPTAPFYRYALE